MAVEFPVIARFVGQELDKGLAATSARIEELEAKLRKLESAQDGLGSSASKAGTSAAGMGANVVKTTAVIGLGVGAYKAWSGASEETRQKVKQLAGEALSMGISIRRASNSIFGIQAGLVAAGVAIAAAVVAYKALTAAVRAFVNSISRMAREVITIGRSFQDLRVQLVTATGSIGAANQAFAMLKKFAAEMPFEVDNLTEAYIRLLGIGLNPTTRELTAFGNIAGGLGKDITELALAIGGAITGETDRLKAFNITARLEGENIRFIYKGVETVVARTAAAIAGYMTTLGETEFAGGAARQAATLSGALSNLDDAWSSAMDTIAQRSGILIVLEQTIRALSEAIGGAEGDIGDLAEVLGNELINAMETAAILMAKVIDLAIVTGFSFQKVGTAVLGLAKITPILGPLSREISTFIDNLKDIAKVEGIGQTERDFRKFFDTLKKSIAEAREQAKDMGEDLANSPPPGGAKGLSDYDKQLLSVKAKLLDVEIALRKEARVLQLIEDAYGRSAKEAEFYAFAVSKGIDPTERMTRGLVLALRELQNLGRMAELRQELDGLIDDLQLVEEGANDALTGILAANSADIAAVGENAGELLMDGIVKAAGDNADQLTSELRAIVVSEWRETVGVMVSDWVGGIGQMVRQGELSWENLTDFMVDSFFRAVERMVQKWIATQFADKSVGISGNNTGGSGLLSGNSGALIPFAVAVGGYLWSQSRQDSRDAQRFTGAGTGGNINGLNTSTISPQTSEEMIQLTLAIERAVQETLASLGALAGELPQIAVRVRNDGQAFLAELQGVVIGTFDNFNAALFAAIQAGFDAGQFEGIGENVRRALGTTARNLEEWQAMLAHALQLDQSLLSDFELASREVEAWFRDILAAGRDFGASASSEYQLLARELEELARQIKTPEDLAAYNALLASLDTQRQDEIAQIIELIAQMQRMAETGVGAGGAAGIVGTEFAKLGTTMTHAANLAGLTLEQLQQRLEELQAVTLPGPATSIPSFGGGGGRRRQEREALEAELQRIVDSALSESMRVVVGITRQMAHLRDEVERLGPNADLASRALQILQQQLRDTFEDSIASAMNPLSEWEQSLADIEDKWDDLVAAERAARRETGEVTVAIWRLNRAREAERAALGQQLLQSVSPMAAAVAAINRTGDALDFLRDNFEDLGLSLADVDAAVNDVIANTSVGFLRQFASLGLLNQDQILALQKAEFALKVAMIKIEVEAARARGLLDQATIDIIDDAIRRANDFINSGTLPNINGGGGGGGGVFPQPPQTVAIAQQQALDLMAAYANLTSQSGPAAQLQKIKDDFQFIFDTLGQNADTLAAFQGAMDAFWQRFIDGFDGLRDSLNFGSASGQTDAQQFQGMFAQATAFVADLNSGSDEDRLAALQALPNLLRDLLRLGPDALGAGGLINLREWVLGVINSIQQGGALPAMPILPGGGGILPGGGGGGSEPGIRLEDNILFAGGSFLGSSMPGVNAHPLSAQMNTLITRVERVERAVMAAGGRMVDATGEVEKATKDGAIRIAQTSTKQSEELRRLATNPAFESAQSAGGSIRPRRR